MDRTKHGTTTHIQTHSNRRTRNMSARWQHSRTTHHPDASERNTCTPQTTIRAPTERHQHQYCVRSCSLTHDSRTAGALQHTQARHVCGIFPVATRWLLRALVCATATQPRTSTCNSVAVAGGLLTTASCLRVRACARSVGAESTTRHTMRTIAYAINNLVAARHT